MEDHTENFEAQTRFAIVGSILASLIILSISMAFMWSP
jgi:hypothetical protein